MSNEKAQYRWIYPKSHDHVIDGKRIEVKQGDIIELTKLQAANLKTRIKLLAAEEAEQKLAAAEGEVDLTIETGDGETDTQENDDAKEQAEGETEGETDAAESAEAEGQEEEVAAKPKKKKG